MSLKIWHPLLGDTAHQGISTVTTTLVNNGPTVSNSGKLGKSMLFTSTQGIKDTAANILSDSTLSGCSVTFWIYPESVGNVYFSIERDTYWQITWQGNKLFIRDSATTWNGTRKEYNVTAPIAQTWSHYIFIYDAGTIKIYLNGILSQTLGPTGGANLVAGINNIVIGTTVQSHTGCTARFNDFRVYNKALTQEEIHELSLGKIAHYLLHAGPNRYTVLPDGYKSIDGIDGHSSELCLTGITATEKTVAYLDYYPTNSNSPFGRGDGAFNITGNSGKISWRWGSPQQTKNAYGPNVNQRIRLWFGQHCKAKYGANNLLSFDFNTSNAFTTSDLYIFGRGGDVLSGIIYKFMLWEEDVLIHDLQPSIRLSDSKVGFLDLITNIFYTHNSWTAIEVTDTIENDCSGLKHDLTAFGFTFNNQYIGGGPRYIRSINFTASSQYLQTTSFDTITTICFWGKAPASWPSSYQCYVADFNNYISMGSGANKLVPRARATGPLYICPAALKLNDWNWFCIIINADKSTKAVYVNNELCTVDSTNNYFTHNTGFSINARNNGSYTNGMNMPMVDLRIFATELSNDDRTKLYNMGRLS